MVAILLIVRLIQWNAIIHLKMEMPDIGGVYQ